MVEVDAGVEHRHGDGAGLVPLAGVGRLDPGDAGRHRLARGERRKRERPHLQVGGHRSHLWVLAQCPHVRGRQLGGEALQGPPVPVTGVEAEVLLALARLRDDLTARDGV